MLIGTPSDLQDCNCLNINTLTKLVRIPQGPQTPQEIEEFFFVKISDPFL